MLQIYMNRVSKMMVGSFSMSVNMWCNNGIILWTLHESDNLIPNLNKKNPIHIWFQSKPMVISIPITLMGGVNRPHPDSITFIPNWCKTISEYQ